MTTVALGDLMPAKKKSIDPRKTPDTVFELLSIPAFDAGQPEVTTGGEIGSSKQVVRPGDVMISKIVPHIRRAWEVPSPTTGEQIASSEWIVFRSERFHPAYLRQLLVSDRFHQTFMQTVAGVGGSLLRARPSYVADIEIPLPPIEEQRRIAAVLDAADELRTKRRQALAKLDTLTQAIFIDMFGDPALNPQGHPEVEIVELQADDGIKCGPFGTQLAQSEYVTEGVPLWGIPQVNKAFRVPTHEFLTIEKASVLAPFAIEPGDIVMTRKGTVGNCAVYPSHFEPGVMHSDLLRLRLSEANPVFMATQLAVSRSVQEQIRVMSGGAIMPGINVTKLKKLVVLAPPVPRQEEFAAAVAAQVGHAELAAKSREHLDMLFASLQQRSFAGEL